MSFKNHVSDYFYFFSISLIGFFIGQTLKIRRNHQINIRSIFLDFILSLVLSVFCYEVCSMYNLPNKIQFFVSFICGKNAEYVVKFLNKKTVIFMKKELKK